MKDWIFKAPNTQSGPKKKNGNAVSLLKSSGGSEQGGRRGEQHDESSPARSLPAEGEASHSHTSPRKEDESFLKLFKVGFTALLMSANNHGSVLGDFQAQQACPWSSVHRERGAQRVRAQSSQSVKCHSWNSEPLSCMNLLIRISGTAIAIVKTNAEKLRFFSLSLFWNILS